MSEQRQKQVDMRISWNILQEKDSKNKEWTTHVPVNTFSERVSTCAFKWHLCECNVRKLLKNHHEWKRICSEMSLMCHKGIQRPDRAGPWLTLVFLLPWTTTGRESWAVFLTRTRSVPNLSSTSSVEYRIQRQDCEYRPGAMTTDIWN